MPFCLIMYFKAARNGILCIPRKHNGVSWPFSYLENEELDRRFDNKLLNRKNLPRYVVVRSELAETGTPHSEYPLSGFLANTFSFISSLPLDCPVTYLLIKLQNAEFKLGSKVRGIFFYAVTAVAAIFLIMPMLLLHPIVLLLDRYQRRFHHFIAKIWAMITVYPFLKIEIEGLENLPPPDVPAVYVSNHQSFLDIYTVLTLGRNFKFISKTGIFLFPVIGWAMSMIGVVPLKRMDSRSQLVFPFLFHCKLCSHCYLFHIGHIARS